MNTSGNSSITAHSGRIWRRILSLLGGSTRVVVLVDRVQFERANGTIAATIDTGRLEEIYVRRSLLGIGWCLTARGPAGERYHIYGLDQESAERVRSEVVRLAVEKAKEVGPGLTELEGRLSVNGYMRYGESRKLHKDIVRQVGAIRQLVERNLETAPFRAFTLLYRLIPEDDFEQARTEWNQQFVQSRVKQVRDSARAHISKTLTEEQCTAIATDEDATLVLAGAGTGKTSVIVGKAVDLVLNRGVSPHEILALAFNKKAVDEIRSRLPRNVSEINVSTFHSFGMSIISDAGNAKPTVSSLADDGSKLLVQLQEFLGEMVESPNESKLIADFLTYYVNAYKSPWHFETRDEYDAYVLDVELRTLNGELVKSFEELLVANFLARNGIEYEYEKRYDYDTRTKSRRQYQPDFYLTNDQVYIEHFALDRDDRAPRHWNWREYERGVAWKRETHARYGTTLVETYSWQRTQGTLLESLETNLRQVGVQMRPVPVEEHLSSLKKESYSLLADLVLQFLNHVRTSRIDADTLRERASGFGDPARAEAFLDVFECVQARYTALLKQRGEIDFHDMINQAADTSMRSGRTSPYRYVLVDEFQDISTGRMELLKALHRSGASFFLVGDDWQSIYRFTGSDVALMQNCSEHLGYVETCRLGQTFRYGTGIEQVSSWFVQQNPAQTKRVLRPFGDVKRDDGVNIIWAADPVTGLRTALQEIEQSSDSAPGSVYALSRYTWTRDDAKNVTGHGRLRVRHSTVHAAKGEEDDYVVVLDLKKDLRFRSGFPSAGVEDPLLELVLPPRSADDRYEFSEERRLFYVAMTRARYGTYLVTDMGAPSPFIDELLERFGGREGSPSAAAPIIRQIGERMGKCPRCQGGHLVLRTNSQNGNRFWGCSNFGKSLNCRYTRNASAFPRAVPVGSGDA